MNNRAIEEFDETLEKLSNFFRELFDDSIKSNNIVEIKNNNDYLDTLKKVLDSYEKNFEKTAFNLHYSEGDLKGEIKDNCKSVLEISKLLIEDNWDSAKLKMKKLLKKYIDEDKKISIDNGCEYGRFLLTEINKSYAFRGSGCNKYFCYNKKDFEDLNRSEIIFYRSRISNNKEIFDKFSKIISLPYSKKEFASSGRFSKKGISCLYLSLSSYTSFAEISSEYNFEEIYTSAFKFNEEGLKKVKVLNLVIYESLLNGVYNPSIDSNIKDEKRKNYLKSIKTLLFKIAPFCIASSFNINCKYPNDSDKRYEYLFSQCIIESLLDFEDDENIYGVAYLSKKEIGKSNYPFCVNLAIPINDLDKNEEFGNLYNYVYMTGPVLNKVAIKNYGNVEKKRKPFIEETFFVEDTLYNSNQYIYDFISNNSVSYKDTDYYKVDYSLANMEMFNAMEKLKSEQ